MDRQGGRERKDSHSEGCEGSTSAQRGRHCSARRSGEHCHAVKVARRNINTGERRGRRAQTLSLSLRTVLKIPSDPFKDKSMNDHSSIWDKLVHAMCSGACCEKTKSEFMW